ncbi:hypothetical protein LSH36_174g08027 [Paralvinella palmiformis]|uniref:Palmitoyltransferase n=1 Tax=Paralvinella palmiformis TaxID=53620 RepID=A0AAD9N5X4_9ANNE|nr:hypothetical protein LSH36_174g08027 [Paralvinella palmiformis]
MESVGKSKRNRKPSALERLNNVAIFWFWFTMLAVYYAGVVEVLPALYTRYASLLWLNRIFCTFVFVQMAMNWACVRYVRSHFRPEEHREYIESHAEEIAADGCEINLNNLIRNPDEEGCTIPRRSLKCPDGAVPAGFASNTLYVIALPPEEAGRGHSGESRHVVYPYWSWKPCVICHVVRPPRAHHCPICNVCVLKRDHHCFFTGSCVGLRNQRHFVVFSFWSAVITSYCLVHSIGYLNRHFLVRDSVADLVLPVAVFRAMLGYVSYADVVLVALLYSVTWFLMTSLGFLYEQCRIISRGITSFELDNNMKVVNTCSLSQNISAVFGDKWWLNFIFPACRLFPEMENGVTWRHVKIR